MKRLAASMICIISLLSGCMSATARTAGPAVTSTIATTLEETAASSTNFIETSPPATTLTETAAATTSAETASPVTTRSQAETSPAPTASVRPNPDATGIRRFKQDALVLMLAYPDQVANVEINDNQAWLVMKSGSRILYDDGRTKSADEKYTDADIQDMLESIYPLNDIDSLMEPGRDPGRARSYGLLNEIYGSTKSAVSRSLVQVGFGEQNLSFSQTAGAAAALKTAAGQAAELVRGKPQLAGYLYPSSGTFNYRVISGTNRLSPHAYGIAIDLKSNPDDYWRWASPAAGEKRLTEYPHELVRLFEKNGFIWGGKWNHFDIMHYEYRPEMILKAKYFPGEIKPGEPWYQGADTADAGVAACIAVIDRSLD